MSSLRVEGELATADDGTDADTAVVGCHDGGDCDCLGSLDCCDCSVSGSCGPDGAGSSCFEVFVDELMRS